MESNIELMELNKENLLKLLGKKVCQIEDKKMEELICENNLYKALGLQYRIIYNFDSVEIGRIDDFEIDLDNIIEARLFNENIEIDFRIDEEKIEGNIFIDNGERELFVEENFYLRGSEFNRLKVKKYIKFDEDNQGYIYYLKPCELLKEA